MVNWPGAVFRPGVRPVERYLPGAPDFVNNLLVLRHGEIVVVYVLPPALPQTPSR